MLSYGVARQSHPWYKRAIVNQFALAVNRCLTSFVGPQACNLRVALSSDAKGIEKLFREEGVRRSWDVQSVIDMDLPYFDIAAISEGKVIGAARVVCGDSGSFPIKKDSAWPNLQISKHSAEVAMAVVDPAYRGDTNVIMSVYAFLYWVLHEMDITHVYAILDSNIYALYRRRLRLNFQKIPSIQNGGDKVYWGELTFPAVLDLEQAVSELKIKNPVLWNLVLAYKPSLLSISKNIIQNFYRRASKYFAGAVYKLLV